MLLLRQHSVSSLRPLISRQNQNGKVTTLANPPISNKRTCISLLKYCKSITHLKQIHAQMFQVGLHQDTDALKKLMAFIADPSKGDLLYAKRMFDSIESPFLFFYNLMIRAFVKSGRYKEAVLLFGELRGGGLWPDNFTYPFVFKAVGCLREILEGEKLHGLVVKTALEFDLFVCNSLMDMYGQLGWVGVARKLFDGMPERDVVSWNVLITGLVRCRRFEQAIHVFCCMRKEKGLRPDKGTVVSTLAACAVTKTLELGKEIHAYVRDELGFTSIIGNALLDMYCKCGCLSIAREIFDEMPSKNVICWTTMVSGYVSCGELDEARELFERSPGKDVVLWTAMLNGYVQFNRFDEAVALFREMQRRRVKLDKYVLVALLTGCAQTGALEQGKWIHGYMTDNNILIDTVIGTALIDMYSKCGFIEKALEIFYRLKEKDAASWTSIICGLSMNGKTSEALQLFSEMKRVGARPDDIAFVGVLSACSHGGLVEEGRKLFDSMTTIYHIEPKLEHYSCLIDLLGRAGHLDEIEDLIKKIPLENNKIIVPLYGAILSACRIYGNVKMGEWVAEQLVKIESSDSSLHTLLANIYASSDRWDDVTKVRRNMKDLGVRKVPGCSLIEVNGRVHEFVVRDPSHSGMPEIYSMLERVAKPSMAEDVVTTSFQ